nr:hypothetical protein [Deinococcus hopiensis]
MTRELNGQDPYSSRSAKDKDVVTFANPEMGLNALKGCESHGGQGASRDGIKLIGHKRHVRLVNGDERGVKTSRRIGEAVSKDAVTGAKTLDTGANSSDAPRTIGTRDEGKPFFASCPAALTELRIPRPKTSGVEAHEHLIWADLREWNVPESKNVRPTKLVVDKGCHARRQRGGLNVEHRYSWDEVGSYDVSVHLSGARQNAQIAGVRCRTTRTMRR